MIRRHWPILTIGAAVLAAGLSVYGQPPAKMPPTTPTPSTPTGDFNAKEVLARQQALELQYKAFTRNLLALAQKLKNSDKVEDQDKAKTLLRAIDLADKEAVDNKFTSLLRTLSKGDVKLTDLGDAFKQNEEIIKLMKQILDIIQSDDEMERLKRERVELEKHLADLNGLIRGIKIVQARNNSDRGDPKKIGEDQKKLADQTDALADRMGANKNGNRNPSGEQKANDKAAGKNGGEGQGENKEDTNKPKGEERIAKMGEPKDPMAGMGGESKGSKGMEGSASESKPSKGMGGMEASASESKGMGMGGMGGMSGMMGDPKDPKNPMMKDPMGMGGDKKDDKTPSEARNKEDNKGQEKGSASQSGMKSPPSDQQASSKSSGSPMSGSPSGSGKPSGGGQPSSSPPPPGGQKPPAPGGENVRKAVQDEDNAASNLDQNKRKPASDDQTNAGKKLEEARQELEKRLKQLREQELERLLANLEARVNKMLAMQIEVKNGTVNIDGVVQKYEDKKPKQIDFQNSQKQSDTEALIIVEADKAIDLLKNEGSAVAFPAVFEEVRIDMLRVKERLQVANVGKDTQDLEDDIITALKQMAEALKKAQQEIGKSPPPKPPGDPSPDQPQLQKLLDEIAELKMIRNLQANVNDRTKRQNKDKVEQTDDPQLRKELKDLSDRQEKIETMINNMATKKNQ